MPAGLQSFRFARRKRRRKYKGVGARRGNFEETKWENNRIENLLGEKSWPSTGAVYLLLYGYSEIFLLFCSVRSQLLYIYIYIILFRSRRFEYTLCRVASSFPLTSARRHKLRANFCDWRAGYCLFHFVCYWLNYAERKDPFARRRRVEAQNGIARNALRSEDRGTRKLKCTGQRLQTFGTTQSTQQRRIV